MNPYIPVVYYVKRSKNLPYLISIVQQLLLTVNPTAELIATSVDIKSVAAGYHKLTLRADQYVGDPVVHDAASGKLKQVQVYDRKDWSILGLPYLIQELQDE